MTFTLGCAINFFARAGLHDAGGNTTRKDGVKYIGEFRHGRFNGQGTWIAPDGRKYVGEFRDGKSNGQGTMIYPDGSKYIGEMHDDKVHGQGIWTHPDGRKYVGEFRDGKMSGQGTMTAANGFKYVGEYLDGKPNGQGILMLPNGSKYVGEFRDGMRVERGGVKDSIGEKSKTSTDDRGLVARNAVTQQCDQNLSSLPQAQNYINELLFYFDAFGGNDGYTVGQYICNFLGGRLRVKVSPISKDSFKLQIVEALLLFDRVWVSRKDPTASFRPAKAPPDQDTRFALVGIERGDKKTEVIRLEDSIQTLLVMINFYGIPPSGPGRLDDAEEKSELTGPSSQGALGMEFSRLTDELRARFNIKDTVKNGVLITAVDPSSNAAQRRVRAGDILLEVAEEAVNEPAKAARVLNATKIAAKNTGKKMVLLIIANGEGDTHFVMLPVE